MIHTSELEAITGRDHRALVTAAQRTMQAVGMAEPEQIDGGLYLPPDIAAAVLSGLNGQMVTLRVDLWSRVQDKLGAEALEQLVKSTPWTRDERAPRGVMTMLAFDEYGAARTKLTFASDPAEALCKARRECPVDLAPGEFAKVYGTSPQKLVAAILDHYETPYIRVGGYKARSPWIEGDVDLDSLLYTVPLEYETLEWDMFALVYGRDKQLLMVGGERR